MNDSVNRGEKVREIYASALERGRFWVPLSLIGPVLLLVLQLVLLLPNRSNKSVQTPAAFWLVIFIAAGIILTFLGVYLMPLLMKRGVKSAVSNGTPTPYEQRQSQGILFSPIRAMVAPVVFWSILGFLYYLIGGNLAVSIPFYVVAFGYWTWFRLTMDVRFDKLCREIGEIASRPVPGPVS